MKKSTFVIALAAATILSVTPVAAMPANTNLQDAEVSIESTKGPFTLNVSSVSQTQLTSVSFSTSRIVTLDTYQNANTLVPSPSVEYSVYNSTGRLIQSKIATGAGNHSLTFDLYAGGTTQTYTFKAKSLSSTAINITYSVTY